MGTQTVSMRRIVMPVVVAIGMGLPSMAIGQTCGTQAKKSTACEGGYRAAGGAELASASGCSGSGTHAASVADKGGPDILDTAVAAGSFKTLATALTAAGMVETLKGDGPFTVFAPTDEAFAKLPPGAIDSLLKDPAKLRAVLKYHVVAGSVSSDQVKKLKTAKTVLGQEVNVAHFFDVRINDAKVVKADVRASNGVIHVIDSVLMPKDDVLDVAAAAGSFKTLLAAVDAAGLADALRSEGPYTVFAPTDEAFAKLPAGTVESLLKDPARLRSILKFHVVAANLSANQIARMDSAKTLNGQNVSLRTASPTRVNNATIVKKDIHSANGVIHVIDAVLMPADDLVCTARQAGSFKTLIKAVQAAGLEDTLRGPGPFTVFAPTDEAFASLPAGTLDALVADPAKLKAILAYHVVAGKWTAAKVLKAGHAETVGGKTIRFTAGDHPRVNDAHIVKTDISTANGVIHVIDKVLVPTE